MTPDDATARPHPVYTSAEASKRTGGLIGERRFLRLAAEGVECTRIGRRVLWTDPQIDAAIQYLSSTKAPPRREPSVEAPASAVPAQRERPAVAPLQTKLGRKYQTAARP